MLKNEIIEKIHHCFLDFWTYCEQNAMVGYYCTPHKAEKGLNNLLGYDLGFLVHLLLKSIEEVVQ